jgi:hypothetical protein
MDAEDDEDAQAGSMHPLRLLVDLGAAERKQQSTGQAMTTHAEKANALAGKITSKAEDALSGLSLEMNLMKWPAEFRGIMWQAVAEIASRRAQECRNQQRQSDG